LHTNVHWGTTAPCTVFEKRPLKDPKGNVVDGLFVAWIRLNNPDQFNSYTTEMAKGVIAGFENAHWIEALYVLYLQAQAHLRSARAGTPKSTASITAQDRMNTASIWSSLIIWLMPYLHAKNL